MCTYMTVTLAAQGSAKGQGDWFNVTVNVQTAGSSKNT